MITLSNRKEKPESRLSRRLNLPVPDAAMMASGERKGRTDMAFDVSRVRAAYPALADGYAYLDGAAGTQVPAAVIGAISGAYEAGLGNSGGAFPASQRSDEIIARC